MMLLNGTLCSANVRKVGLVQAIVNLSTQILCLIIIFKVVIEASPHKRGYFVHGHRVDKTQETLMTHILIDIMFFLVIDIIAYSWLIFGLVKRRQTILTIWLLFSIMELITVQISTFYFAVYLTITSHSGISVLGLTIPTLVTLYMIYNICVIYTVRHHIARERRRSVTLHPNILNSDANTLHYRIPHALYGLCQEISSRCDLQSGINSQSDTSFPATPPPPYKSSSEA